MKLLAVETGCESATVALWEGEADGGASTLTEARCGERGRTSVELLPAMDGLLKVRSWGLADLDGVAVSIGPGSFTGLRIGVSVVKGLARVRPFRILAVGALEAVARSSGVTGLIAACLDGKRGEIFAQVFRREGHGLESVTDEVLAPPADWAASLGIAEPLWCVGDGAVMYETVLREILGGRVTVVDHPEMTPAAGAAWLAASRWATGASTPAADLLPRYLRRSTAEINWERGIVGRRRRVLLGQEAS